METRIGNDIILNVNPNIFGVSGVDNIESTEAVFVRYEEPCCHDNCCSQFCNPTPCCNGGCNYYNASPVNIYGIPTHCPPPRQCLYVDKIYSLSTDTKTIKYKFPGDKQYKLGLYSIVLRAILKNAKINTVQIAEQIRLIDTGVVEQVTLDINGDNTNTPSGQNRPIPTGINLSYFDNKLTIALKDNEEDISDTLDIPEATSVKNGLMSALDKNRLDSLILNNNYSIVIKNNLLYITDMTTNTTYKTSVTVDENAPDIPIHGYNIFIGFGRESIDSISDINSLSNSVHYVLLDVSDPDTEDGAYHITSTSENVKNDNASNLCYIWVCSQLSFKRLTSNGFTMPSQPIINIDGYYCKRVTDPITVIGDNIIEIIR